MSSTGKFKVGDRVRLIRSGSYNGYGDFGRTGECGEVVKHTAYDDQYEVNFEESGKWWAESDNLEPVAVAQQPQPLRIQPGKFYRTRDGRKVGPATPSGDPGYPWWVGGSTYTDSGAWVDGLEDDNDLVAEADEPPAEPQNNKEILDELEAWIAEQDAIKAADNDNSTAGFTVPLCAYDDELENEVDATLTAKITVDFSDFDAELDRIFGRPRKLKRKARKMGISLDAGELQDAA